MYKKLLVDRNRTWMPKIDDLLARRGHAFIVVGAAHLVGPDGLLAHAEGQGLHRRAVVVRSYSCRSATVGSTRPARRAGG